MQKVNYKRPPIVEAVIDLRIRHKEGFDFSQLTSFAADVSSDFPLSSPIQLLNVNFDASVPNGEARPVVPSQFMQIGLRLANEKNNHILQVQEGGFTFSHLAPYDCWETFSAQAKALWAKFVSNNPSFVVTRCAVRFINKVAVPLPRIRLSDYFNLYPQIPQGIPQNVAGMLLQLQMPQPDLGASTAVINLALADSDNPVHTTVLLDIDLFSPLGDIDPQSEDIWNAFDLYRDRKNELFEAFITNKARRLFV